MPEREGLPPLAEVLFGLAPCSVPKVLQWPAAFSNVEHELPIHDMTTIQTCFQEHVPCLVYAQSHQPPTLLVDTCESCHLPQPLARC